MKSNLDKPAKIAILGGGLVGRLLAWRLATDASNTGTHTDGGIVASAIESTIGSTIKSTIKDDTETDNGITKTITHR